MELALGIALLLLLKGRSGSSSGGNSGSGAGGGSSGDNTLNDVKQVVGGTVAIAGTVAGGLKAAGLLGGGASSVAGGSTIGGTTAAGGTTATGTGAAAGGGAAGGGASAADEVIPSLFEAADLLNPALIAVEVVALFIILSMIAYDLTTGFHTWRFRMGKFLGLGQPSKLSDGSTNPRVRGYAHFRANRIAVNLLEQVSHSIDGNWPLRQELAQADDYSWRNYVDGQWLGALEGPMTLKWLYSKPLSAANMEAIGLICHYLSVHYAWWAARYEQLFLFNLGGQTVPPPYLDHQELWDRVTPTGTVPAMSWVDFNNELVRAMGTTSLAGKLNWLKRKLQFAALCDGVFDNLKGDPDVYFPWDAWDYAIKRFNALGLSTDDCALIPDANGHPRIQFGLSWGLHAIETSAGVVWPDPGSPPPPGQVAHTSVSIVDAKDGLPFVRGAA